MEDQLYKIYTNKSPPKKKSSFTPNSDHMLCCVCCFAVEVVRDH